MRTSSDKCIHRCALVLTLVLAGVAWVVPEVQAQPGQAGAEPSQEERECGSFFAQGRNGPSDYRDTPRNVGSKLWLVENAHFTPGIRTLTKPATGPYGVDLDYTLYSFPNHHPALVVMDKLGQREKTDKPEGASHSVDCYYRRAIRFVPNDLLVRILYGNFLGRQGHITDALKQLDYAASQAGDNGFTHYNIGLSYLGLKAYEPALRQEHRAQSLGFIRPELQKGLQDAGQWREPPMTAASTFTPNPAASR